MKCLFWESVIFVDCIVIVVKWIKNNFILLVTRCINKFNIQQLYALTTLYLCVV
jgi:hypothetical protein